MAGKRGRDEEESESGRAGDEDEDAYGSGEEEDGDVDSGEESESRDESEGEGEAEEERGDEEERTVEQLKQAMASMPLGELMKLRARGVNGVPLSKFLGGSAPTPTATATQAHARRVPPAPREREEQHEPKKRSKHAPVELPSTRRPSRTRQVVSMPSVVRRDPRFSVEASAADAGRFLERFEFLDEQVDGEIKHIRDTLQRESLGRQLKGAAGRKKRRLTEEEVAALQADLTRLEQYRAETRRARAVNSRVKQELQEGHRVTRKDKRRFALEQRFKELSAKPGKLGFFLEERRKRAASKERRRAAAASASGEAGPRRGSSAPPLGF